MVMLAIVSVELSPTLDMVEGEVTFLLALRLAAGICRVTLYSVFLSSSSAMKLASCTSRLAFTICSRSFRKLRVSIASLSALTESREKIVIPSSPFPSQVSTLIPTSNHFPKAWVTMHNFNYNHYSDCTLHCLITLEGNNNY